MATSNQPIQSRTNLMFSFVSYSNTQDLRVPLILIDGIIIYGLHFIDRRTKSRKLKAHTEKDIVKEIQKKEIIASKMATRQQHQQAFKKQIHNQGKAYPSTVPKAHIQQPDKMK